MATCKDCEFGGSCVMLHKSDSQVCNIFTHKKDYVEVVRCKDCIGKAHWYKNDYGCTICGLSGLFVVEDRDFCSYGERKDNERKAD